MLYLCCGLQDSLKQGYIVLDFDGINQQELYSSVYVKLSSMYVSPKDVLSVVENNSITINGIGSKAIYRKKNFNNLIPTYDINYTMTILFKDGKIRINNPVINSMYRSDDITDRFYVVGASALGVTNGVFTPKGKIVAVM